MYGFFGSHDDTVETFSFVNYMLDMCWGDRVNNDKTVYCEFTLDRLRKAKDAGVNEWILNVDWLLFKRGQGNILHHRENAAELLRDLFNRLKENDLLSGLIGLYPQDEPETKELGLTTHDIAIACSTCKDVAAEYPELANIKLVTCYGPSENYLGLEYFRPGIIGLDDYGARDNILKPGEKVDRLIAQLAPDQQMLLFPGGCDSNDGSYWRADPTLFYEYAQANDRVAGICGFIWLSNWAGTNAAGIRNNGMRPIYEKIGLLLK